MSKLRIVMVASFATLLAVGVVQKFAYADSSIDCSSLKKWNSDKTYKKGDLVWIREGGMNDGAEWKCTADKCVGAGQQPGAFSKTWVVVASCKNRPS
jgi:hypothetical protein